MRFSERPGAAIRPIPHVTRRAATGKCEQRGGAECQVAEMAAGSAAHATWYQAQFSLGTPPGSKRRTGSAVTLIVLVAILAAAEIGARPGMAEFCGHMTDFPCGP